MTYAPVLISVYNRLWHFQQCIESLAKNPEAFFTDLYIAIDAPFQECDIESVGKVFSYAKDITGFKNVTVFMRERNLGPRENILQAINFVFARYDRMILSEDDNYFSPDFLDFINRGLDEYENRDDILAVCGYNYPVQIPESYQKDVYAWTGFSAWGYGILKNKWEQIDREPSCIAEFLKDKKNIRKLDKIAGIYYPHLQSIVATGRFTGDTIICYHLFMHSQYCVFPVVSRVRNLGHDGTGEHCGVDTKNIYSGQVISDGKTKVVFDKNIQTDEKIYTTLRQFFKRPRLYKTKKIVKKLIRYKIKPQLPINSTKPAHEIK